jgi:hypothetical protein
MRIEAGNWVSLGYGAYARSDEVVALRPITEGRGPGRRTLVWVRGVDEPIVASRSEEAITRDLVAPGERSLRADQLATALERLVEASESLPPVLQRAIRQETGQDFSALARDGHTALDE